VTLAAREMDRINRRKEFKVKKGKVVAVLNYALHHEDVWGNGCIAPSLFDLRNSWR
jgi:hypothetical protein